MARTIAEQLVELGLAKAEDIPLPEPEDQKLFQVHREPAPPRRYRSNKAPGSPGKRVCVACGEEYEFFRTKQYPGKSTKRCPSCQSKRTQGVTNQDRRPAGHKTRQQHKRVFPGQI